MYFAKSVTRKTSTGERSFTGGGITKCDSLLGAPRPEAGLATVDAGRSRIDLFPPTRTALCFLSAGNTRVDDLVEAVTSKTGSAPQLSTGGGTSDARFIARYCPVVELGLIGTTMHQIDERVSLTDLKELTGLYETIITQFMAR